MNKPSITMNQPARKDRAKDEEWIKVFLQKIPFGTLATEYEGQPSIKPTLFAYAEAEAAIYIHGALVGRMRTQLEANPRVSFCIAEMGRLLPADTAMEVGVEYASVVVFGKAELLSDADQARHGLQLLLDRYFPHLKSGEDYREIQKEELDITSVYKISIESWSGKEEHARPDFPGAFNFKAP
ncbi:MAG TPA: pyridoxamine 5'-phosphate oxidase family protein [Anaerolineales bacterium]|nr:pyridoxamine 5'-phosphate oxidase family protein [Anaerolineales bacterium]